MFKAPSACFAGCYILGFLLEFSYYNHHLAKILPANMDRAHERSYTEEIIMKVSVPQVKKLLTGVNQFKMFAFSMMLTNLKEVYAKDSSFDTLESCTAEINRFLEKYHVVMAADYEIIAKL